jgi:hypothetical protein
MATKSLPKAFLTTDPNYAPAPAFCNMFGRRRKLPEPGDAQIVSRLAKPTAGGGLAARLAIEGENRSLSAGLPASITSSKIKPLRPVVRLSLWRY